LSGVLGAGYFSGWARFAGLKMLAGRMTNPRLVSTDAERPTTRKQPFLATVEQRQPHPILRVDHERTHPLTADRAQS